MTLSHPAARIKRKSTKGITLAVADLMIAKGYDIPAIVYAAKESYLSHLVETLVRRESFDDELFDDDNPHFIDALFSEAEIVEALREGRSTAKWSRDISEVDYALWSRGHNDIVGKSVAHRASIPDSLPSILPQAILKAPIAIIGFGPAGIMARAGLHRLGFENISVYERSKALGIWSIPHVANGSRNNPRDLLYDLAEDHSLHAAPGGGYHVVEFLQDLMSYAGSDFTKTSVSSVKSGDLEHVLEYSLNKKMVRKSFPIVINSMGLGKPRPLSDEKRMTCLGSEKTPIRWQQSEIEAGSVRGKTIVMIGLGNSTAEILRQLHVLQDHGEKLDYRILTHFPAEAVKNPNQSFTEDGKVFRVFRNPAEPNLTSYQGDLRDSRADYFRALENGKILPGVSKWQEKKGALSFTDKSGKKGEAPCDTLYVLIGYEHQPKTYDQMGCTYDADTHSSLHDYDGEVILNPTAEGREFFAPGHFGFGAMLNSPRDRNSIVIPGMLFRLPDLLSGVVMRATEWSLRNEKA